MELFGVNFAGGGGFRWMKFFQRIFPRKERGFCMEGEPDLPVSFEKLSEIK